MLRSNGKATVLIHAIFNSGTLLEDTRTCDLCRHRFGDDSSLR